MRWIAALRTAQKIAVGAHSICARKVYRAGNAPGGYGIRPYILFLPQAKTPPYFLFLISYFLFLISYFLFIISYLLFFI